MAEFAAINEAFLVEVPDAVDLTLAALTEPLSVAIHAMEKASLRPGKRVIVTGPGPIGMMCAALAHASGADVLLAGTEADERTRLPVARDLGLKTINISREQLGTFLKDYPQDIWVEASGSTAALNSAINLMPRGGEIVAVAMYSNSLSWSPTISVRAEHSYHFSYASSFRDYRYALDLLQSGGLGLRSLFACYPLDKAHEAFEAAEKGVVVKPVLVPS
jgi:L-iditol 2-dehydrogenase